MLKYKMDILEGLKAKGYNMTRIRAEGLLSQSALQYIREGKIVGVKQINELCGLLECQPGDLMEYVKEED